MNSRLVWSRVLIAVGLVAMLAGLIDPLEGSFAALAGSAIASLGAAIGRSRHRVPLFLSLGLIAVGVAVMVGLSAEGGCGGSSGRSMWWGILIIPYLVGWLLGLIASAAALTESSRPIPPPRAMK